MKLQGEPTNLVKGTTRSNAAVRSMPKKRPMVAIVEKTKEAKGYNSKKKKKFIWENINQAKSFLVIPAFAYGRRGVALLEIWITYEVI